MAERAGGRRGPFLVRHWKPIAIGLGVVVVLNLLLHFLVIRRAVESHQVRLQELSGQQAELTALSERVAELVRVQSRIACTRSDVDHLFQEVLSSKVERMTAIMKEVRRLATSNGVDPDRVRYSPNPLSDGSGLVRFPISFPMDGQYKTLRKFIDEVESSDEFLFIEDISLAEDRALGAATLRLDVRVVTYFQNPDLEQLGMLFRGR